MTEFRESTKLTEDQFDEIYGGTANESPLHLTEEQLRGSTSAISEPRPKTSAARTCCSTA
jgi:hypothetical protein